MRKLVLFGDSWTNGFTKEDGVEKHIDDNLGKQISERLGVDVDARGEEGASNQKIANNVIRYIQKHDCTNVAMLIVWSEKWRMPVVRRESQTGDPVYHYDDPHFMTHMTTKKWKSIEHVWPDVMDHGFNRMLMEQCIHAVRMVLKENAIPYLFTNSIDNFWMKDEMNLFHGRGSKNEFIGGDQLHHTLLDILLGLYKNPKYKDSDLNLRQKRELTHIFRIKHDNIRTALTKCEHPTKEGVGRILDKILPEIEQILKRKKDGTIRF
jgi:hypothetical protein